jgi:DNA methylase
MPIDNNRIVYHPGPGVKHNHASLSPIIAKVEIGPHTLYRGDAYQIRPTLGFFDADVLDPQYEFDNSGGGAWRNDRGASNQMVEEGLCDGFEKEIINPLLCGSAVVFCHENQTAELKAYLDGSFHRCVQLNWHKIAPAPHRNKNYLADTEVYFHTWNRSYHPVGAHEDMNRYIIAGRMPGAKAMYRHPTVKPEAVMDKIMRNVNGQTICDPFMGTGSTGVAAIKAGKTFTGVERNPKHFETAIRRIGAAYEEKQNG